MNRGDFTPEQVTIFAAELVKAMGLAVPASDTPNASLCAALGVAVRDAGLLGPVATAPAPVNDDLARRRDAAEKKSRDAYRVPR